MSEYSSFLSNSARKSGDEIHRKRLLKVIGTYDSVVVRQKSSQWIDWQKARGVAEQIKEYALANLPELLTTFEKNASARGMKVLWAEDVAEAQQHVMEIMRKRRARIVVKSKSMITEEIGLNELLAEHQIEVIESDLGELIVQLAGEKPYHIVTPAMHKSKAEISELFQRKLGAPPTDDAQVLAMAARAHLRQTYVTADVGISGANFLIADEGAISITENEGNARLSISCPSVHIAIAGIEKIIPRLTDLELFLPLLSTSGTGQQVSAYNSVIRGPRQAEEVDGPEEMYLILLDNGRTKIYAQPDLRESLRCIRCGACLNACPVYKSVGGHSYHTTYQGPIGSVITPHLRGLTEWNHLSFASSLCGACTDVCPVKIPLHHLLLANRAQVDKQRVGSAFWRGALMFWAWLFEKRENMEVLRPLLRRGLTIAAFFARFTNHTPLPSMAKRTFAEQWEDFDRSTQISSKENHGKPGAH